MPHDFISFYSLKNVARQIELFILLFWEIFYKLEGLKLEKEERMDEEMPPYPSYDGGRREGTIF